MQMQFKMYYFLELLTKEMRFKTYCTTSYKCFPCTSLKKISGKLPLGQPCLKSQE